MQFFSWFHCRVKYPWNFGALPRITFLMAYDNSQFRYITEEDSNANLAQSEVTSALSGINLQPKILLLFNWIVSKILYIKKKKEVPEVFQQKITKRERALHAIWEIRLCALIQHSTGTQHGKYVARIFNRLENAHMQRSDSFWFDSVINCLITKICVELSFSNSEHLE